jgi:hypothetical protein
VGHDLSGSRHRGTGDELLRAGSSMDVVSGAPIVKDIGQLPKLVDSLTWEQYARSIQD